MEITKAVLEARRKELAEQFAKLSSDRDAVSGAIQDINYWLAQLSKPEKQETAPLGPIAGLATARKT